MGATEFFQGVGHSLGYPIEYSLCMVADLKQVRQPGQSEDPGPESIAEPLRQKLFTALVIAKLKPRHGSFQKCPAPRCLENTQLPTVKKQLPTVKSALKSP